MIIWELLLKGPDYLQEAHGWYLGYTSLIEECKFNSTGTIASNPYAKEKGVSPLAIYDILLKPIVPMGARLPHAPSAYSNFVFGVCFNVLLTAFTCTLLWGWTTAETFLDSKLLVEVLELLTFELWVLLPDINFLGRLNLQIMDLFKKS